MEIRPPSIHSGSTETGGWFSATTRTQTDPSPIPTGMTITHQILAALSRGYSIAVLPGAPSGSLPSFAAGSEGDSHLLLFEAPDFKPRVIAEAPGGFISTWPVKTNGNLFLASSTEFKPGFDAADSRLMLYPLDCGERPEPTFIADLPYTHRVAAFEKNGASYLLASTLCAAKADKEDWTQPGGIHLARVPADPTQPWSFRQIVSGRNKNHGMDRAKLGRDQRDGYLLSCMEGLTFLPIPEDPEGEWKPEPIDPDETSDAFAFDWDGDGEPEIFSISPFHGNVLAIHKNGPTGWSRQVIHDDLAMGHIVWAGMLLGQPGLLAGSRRENRELRLYRPAPDGSVNPKYQLIAAGIGPTQIAVIPRSDREAVLYVAAHGVDEVRTYTLSL